MSTSARDHYNLLQAQKNLVSATDESEDRAAEVNENEDLVQMAQEELVRRQEALRRSRHSLMASEVAVETAQGELKEALMTATTVKSKPAGIEIDPNTGLPEGAKITVLEEAHLEYVQKVNDIWRLLKEYDAFRFCDNFSEEESRDAVAMSVNDETYASIKRLRHGSEKFSSVAKMTTEELKLKRIEKWEEIKAAEHQLSKTLDSTQCVVNRRLLGDGNGAVQTTSTEFVTPHTIQSDEVVSKTMEYAKSNPEETKEDMYDLIVSKLDGASLPRASRYPDGVCRGVMKMIKKKRSELENYHLQIQRNGANDDDGDAVDHPLHEGVEDVDGFDEGHVEAIGAGDDEDDNSDDNSEENEENEFEMTDDVWSAIGSAVRNEIVANRNQNEGELKLPAEGSAPIARYNPQAHFMFLSEVAKASVNDLDEAILCCKLRSRPEDSGSVVQPVLTQLPHELDVYGLVSCLDLDGDCLAMCGELDVPWRGKYFYAAAMHVPYPTNVTKSTNLGEDNVNSTENCEPADRKRNKKKIYKGRKHCFETCIADEKNGRLWASSSQKGIICGYSSADDMRRQDRPVGLLAFDATERKAQRKHANSRFYIAKCGDFIVGSAGTNRLSIWNGQKAVDEFQFPEESENDEDSDSDQSEGVVGKATNKNNGERKRLCSGRLKRCDGGHEYKGLPAHIATIEDEGFSTGDVQALDESTLIVGPARGDSSTEAHSHSIRLVDLASEGVVGLFCGNQGPVSIEKQYCAKEASMIFTTDGGTSFVWDTRTYRPAMLLHSRRSRDVRVLGIPGSSSMAAFTFGPYMECIECWDLRMPICHAYTMATGNSKVTNMFWHHRTSSLLAMTHTDHTVTFRGGDPYMYGDALSDSAFVEVYKDNWWPPGAQHEPLYFGPNHWNLYEPMILQYSFQAR